MLNRILHELYVVLMKVSVVLMPSASYMLFSGVGSRKALSRHIAHSGVKHLLVVTDKPLVELGIVDKVTKELGARDLQHTVFDSVLPDPSYEIVEQGAAAYRQSGCDGILAIGGGSSIDAAKIIGVAVSNPGEPKSYVGFGKVKQDIPAFFAIPTTSGTGSEATMGAVITDTATNEKGIISGAPLLPQAACLDAELLTGLPVSITAATGMDALTHAIEAYIGVWDAGTAKACGAKAVRLIFEHLEKVCADGSNLDSRDAMAYASYVAGQAINQVNVGNVHAIAHQLGALYHVPHGLANALVLPLILELSLDKARPRMTELANIIGRDSAEDFIAAVRELRTAIGIPEQLDKLQPEDFDLIATRAVKEAFAYPAPLSMTKSDVEKVLRTLQPS